MTAALQRQEPGDPRVKVIEAMARALVGSVWDVTSDRLKDVARRQVADCLAALEAEGWGLTSTREGDLQLVIDRAYEAAHEFLDDPQTALTVVLGWLEGALSSVPVEEWRSDCCGSTQMTTRGGDGSPGSPCWTVCGECGETCEALPSVPVEEEGRA